MIRSYLHLNIMFFFFFLTNRYREKIPVLPRFKTRDYFIVNNQNCTVIRCKKRIYLDNIQDYQFKLILFHFSEVFF